MRDPGILLLGERSRMRVGHHPFPGYAGDVHVHGVRKPVDERDADVGVELVPVAVLIRAARSHADHVQRPVGARGRRLRYPIGEGASLARVAKEQQAPVPLVAVHVLDGHPDVCGREDLVVLKFEEFLAAMPRDVDKHGVVLGATKHLARWRAGRMTPCEDAQEGVHGHFVAAVIHLDVLGVDVDAVLRIQEQAAAVRVPGIAARVVCEHQDLAAGWR
mmetsp:Transcript_43563/g.136641  ORF Transcript_43563/g.136641 Transcript_43563/m.136641 type:complete len:218 (-) Transcript_43563:490-1143(-)